MSPTEQRMMALEIANTVRGNGAVVRREVHAGLLSIDRALEDPRAQGLPIGQLLSTQRGWGPSKTSSLLNRHGIWPTRRVRDLTARQRLIITAATRRDEDGS